MKKFIVSMAVALLASTSFGAVAMAAASSAAKPAPVRLTAAQIALRATVAALKADLAKAKSPEEKAVVQGKLDAAIQAAQDSGMSAADVNLVLAVVQQEEATAATADANTPAPTTVTVVVDQQEIIVIVPDPQSGYRAG